MKVLVTGGTGFIGSNFVRHIADTKYYDIKVLSKRTGVSTTKALADILDRIELEDLDLQDYSRLCRQIKGADRIIHFAAASHVAKSIEDPEPFIYTNVVGTMNLLNAAMDVGIPRFIYISSCEVYGESSGYEQGEENCPLYPRSPYAASKAGADVLCQSYITTYNYPIVILRPCNNYGPWQHPEKVIPRFIHLAMTSQDITIHGDGSQSREWLYVRDCAEAIYGAMNIEPGIYNIGSGDLHSIRHIANTILELFPDSDSKILHIENREGQVGSFRLAGDTFYRATGWMARTTFYNGIRNTINWYREHWKSCKQ